MMSTRDLRTKLQSESSRIPFSLGNEATLQLNLNDPIRVGFETPTRADRAANIYLVCARENHNVHS